MHTLDMAKKVIKTEIDALLHLSENLDESFLKAVNYILSTSGRVIICGMGKSGIIGRKIAASFASTGTPSFFMHPGEAFHGDLGMITESDVFIAISNSGETDEVIKLLPFLQDNKNKIIAITGNPDSTLALHADCNLNIAVPAEACPLLLAPTSSTTATLVMGDALTVTLMARREFKPENFARFHPGGTLGRLLLSTVKNEMITNLPTLLSEDSFSSIVGVVSSGGVGLGIILDNTGILKGIITDGDIRRCIDKYGKEVFDLKADNIMQRKPVTIDKDVSIQVAIDKMEKYKITALIVVENNKFIGVLKK